MCVCVGVGVRKRERKKEREGGENEEGRDDAEDEEEEYEKSKENTFFNSPVGPQPELLHRVLDRDEVPDVKGDRVGKVLGGGVCLLPSERKRSRLRKGEATERKRAKTNASSFEEKTFRHSPRLTTWTLRPIVSQCCRTVSQYVLCCDIEKREREREADKSERQGPGESKGRMRFPTARIE